VKKLSGSAMAALFAYAAVTTMSPVSASAQTPGYDANGCGWYIILGCSTSRSVAQRTLRQLGGPMVGGGAGSRVLNTSDVGGFRSGFYCVADGPYISQAEASSVAWVEAAIFPFHFG
jgi:opacity protein-like surface antigen